MRDPLASWLIERFAPEDQQAGLRRGQLSLLEGYTSVVVNSLLFAVKLAIGLITGSIALIADAVHTLADSITSVVVIVSAYVARRPAAREHPFGHGRAELVAARVVAVLLAVAAFEFGKSSVLRILEPATLNVPWWAAGVVAATALGKQWLSVFASVLARLSGSKALEADAWHHRSDVYATLLVVVGMVGARYGLGWLDGVMGLLVSAVIGWAAYHIAAGAIDPLLGEAPSAEELGEIAARARTLGDVHGVHDIVVHKYGDTRVISLHVETSESLSARECHLLAERVQERVGEGGHGSVVVHVDPINDDHPYYGEVQQLLAGVIEPDPRLESFHDLRLVGDAELFTVLADVSVQQTLSEPQHREILARVLGVVQARFPQAKVVLSFEPVFAYGEMPPPSDVEASEG